MTQDTMNNQRYRLIQTILLTILLTVLLPGSNVMAQSTPSPRVNGSVYGGGNMADVQGNTEVNISAGTVAQNVYGGGKLGDVGLITKSADYNYTWKQNDGNTANTNGNNTITGTNNNTGICTVTISGGTIGASGALSSEHGNVFGAGKGAGDTFWCEKAIAFATNVSVSGGTVNGNVYGGGQIGRVEDDTKVTIAGGTAETTGADVKGSVFAAGAGLATHGYSALVRGNTKLTVEGYANVAKSVYGGGETASVGRYGLNAQKMPNILVGGGRCELKVQGNATIGEDVFGACMGVTPAYNNEQGNENRSKRMVTYDPEREENPHVPGNENSFWNFCGSDHQFVWEYFTTEEAYLQYLKTLALATHPEVTIDGSATVGHSVFGGGELGLTKGTVIVNIQGGTVGEDVYGGGALADTNTTELVADNYPTTTPTLNDDGSIKTKEVHPTTTVNLLGGTINGDAYGGGLGRIGVSAVEAVVHGNISVNLGRDKVGDEEYADVPATAFHIDYYTGDHSEVVKSGRIFGCNNLNGSPQNNVTVTVWKTVPGNRTRTAEEKKKLKEGDAGYVEHTYEVAAVYGGGNLANYTATGKKANVYIKTCDTSIRYVYGGGNAAAVPETNVQVEGAYEIQEVFGGGNGKDPYTLDDGDSWTTNPGADVNGNTNALLTGGFIHEAYGGSNQKGTIAGTVTLNAGTGGDCSLDVEKMVTAGKNADINGNAIMILGCMPEAKVDEIYGGADNANVNGNVELTITSGNFGKVFGGNNRGGVIKGHIKVNIEETGCRAINIDNLYLGGNEAPYSRYGYYDSGSTDPVTGKPTLLPRTSADDGNAPVKRLDSDSDFDEDHPFVAYDNPVLNVISCTSIGNVFGGGLGETATMYADPTVNINMIQGAFHSDAPAKDNPGQLGAIGNVFGGGNEAAVCGNTTVNIGTATTVQMTSIRDEDGNLLETQPEPTVTGAYITGNVYGGGNNADVTGNATVTISGDDPDDLASVTRKAVIIGSVYGGGNLGSVGHFTRDTSGSGHSHDTGTCLGGKPNGLATENTGTCTVTVNGWTEIGPNNMQMTKEGGPDDTGYIFGASRGEVKDPAEDPDIDFRTYVYKTDVTVGGHAFVKGSVYGGSENGRVLNDTYVKIQDHCQIGNGWNSGAGVGFNARYDEDLFINPATATATEIATAAASLHECAHWDYGKDTNGDDKPDEFLPYDKYTSTSAAATTASDGHTFYGNVFGGGSGLYPYEKKDGSGYEWLRSAGRVEGNTHVEITGGHILTSVYGGCELTDVGNGLEVESGKGMCFVKMSGGTLGVPRTLEQIAAHPVTCYLFGAGKGDQRTQFNQWTNVGNVRVEINDSISQPIIYGSIFGGGEDGHVLGDVKMDIKGGTIGTWGTSYVDGNVFGGGRGFGGDALTAGVVSGNVDINIEGGQMLGSIYGGGRLGSVGTYLVPEGDAKYGELIPDGEKVTIDIANGTVTTENSGGGNHGHVTIDIKGGTIGNNYEYLYVAPSDNNNLATLKSNNHIPNTDFEDYTASDKTVYKRLKHTKGGNVFAGSMGRLYALDGSTVLKNWLDLGKVKSTKVNISGTAAIKSSVYGGGELGWTSGTHTNATDGKNYSTEINISGGTIGTVINEKVGDADVPRYTFGSVFGGGYGSTIVSLTDANSQKTYPKFQAGRVKYDTKVNMSAGEVLASVYGGGEVASVGYGFYSFSNDQYGIGETALAQLDDDVRHAANTYVTVSGGTIGKAPIIAQAGNTYFGGAKMGNVYGGGSGTDDIARCGLVLGNTNVSISGTNTRIYHSVYGGGAYGSVGDYAYSTETVDAETKVTDPNALHTSGTGTANVTISGGIIGYDGKNNGMVYGSSRGDVQGDNSRENYMAWVYDTHVTIGTSDLSTSPHVRGSVYGSGENGHVFHDTDVKIYSGTVGIDNADTEAEGYIVVSDGTTYHGPEYPSRGNVYGGGCGTDTYEKNSLTYYNPTAGIVKGNTSVTMTGGHVVCAVYGGGSMGSVGTFTNADATYHASHTDVPVGKPISCTDGTGTCTVSISGGKIGPRTMAMPFTFGNVFGAGRGEAHDPAVYANLETSAYFNQTDVTISGTAFVKGSVYGGSESGHVLNDTKVTIEGGQIGCGNGKDVAYTDAEWTAEDPATLVPVPSWEYEENGYGYDMYASTEEGKLDKYPDGTSTEGGRRVATDGHTFYGNVFGGGSGYIPYAAGHWLETAGRVEGNTVVEIKGGHILSNVYGGNECTDVLGTCSVDMTGGTVGVPYPATGFNPALGHLFGAGKGDKRIFFNTWTNVKETTVNVSGGRVFGSVYGGGEDGHVGFEGDTGDTDGDATTTISGTAHIGTNGNSGYDGNVFGGGQGSSTALTAGVVQGNVTLNIQNGQIDGSVYGGGRIASVGTHLVPVDDDNYGELQNDANHGNITVNLTGGTINQDAFGGCMGSRAEVSFPNSKTQDDMGVSRNVTLHLNKDVADTGVKGCVVKGHIFGCNNQNSSPRGQVTVHIHKTQNKDATQIANADASGTEGQEGYTAAVNDAKVEDRYDVSAVYGGGNLAAYVPMDPTPSTPRNDTDEKTEVIIDGCGLTSIGQVYGGGNAASAPATLVTVNGTFEIGQLFGGGNGYDDITVNGVTMPNPGANVGYGAYDDNDAQTPSDRDTYYGYGTGVARTYIYGGTIHSIYGGSNSKGNIRTLAHVILDDVDVCSFNIGEAFGGGKNANMDGEARLEIRCISQLGAVYGGAENADVLNNVTLNITNGTYDQVFGGNKSGGRIGGTITVNVEETGCKPVIIGELYAGGNLAAYSKYGYKKVGGNWEPRESSTDTEGSTELYTEGVPYGNPTLNVKSFTSIGAIYGGGYGSPAKMVADPTVKIDVVKGKFADDDKSVYAGEVDKLIDGDHVTLPAHEKGKIGAIWNVFGGGNQAEVIGSPNVLVGTQSTVRYVTDDAATTDINETEIDQNVVGVKIIGNVFGGGNNANVTGNPNVVIGRKKQ